MSTIDSLEEQLELARSVPPWAVAVIVLCALSLLAMLVVCGFACGLAVQQHVQKDERKKRLITSDSAVQELELQENVALTPTPPASETPRKKGKMPLSDDMEL